MARTHRVVDVSGSNPVETVVPFSDEEETAADAAEAQGVLNLPIKAAARLRAQRNQLLAETDGVFSSDAPDALATQELKDYRQALRDLPANTDDIYNPVWPTKPEGA